MKTIEIYKTFKFKLKPNSHQRKDLAQCVGNKRYVYNWGLNQRIELYKATVDLSQEDRINAMCECNYTNQEKQLKHLRNQFPFLKKSPINSLQSALEDLDAAFKRFYKINGTGFPRFKTKGDKDSFTEKSTRCFRYNDQAIMLPKIGWVRYFGLKKKDGRPPRKHSQKIVGDPCKLTVTREGKNWFCSITTRQEVQVAPPDNNSVAIDLGTIKSIATSDREVFNLPVATKEELKFQKKLQKKIARKQKGSKRRKKAVERYAKHKRHITKRVNDKRNKSTFYLAKNHVLIVVEALKIKNMTRSAKGTIENPGTNVKAKSGLNRVIQSQGFGITINQLKYKCYWYGGYCIAVDPRFSSQECSKCHHTDPDNRPTQALFLCGNCGYEENADIQATFNLLEDGIEAALRIGILQYTDGVYRPADGLAAAARRGPREEFKEARTCGAKVSLSKEEQRALPAQCAAQLTALAA